MHQNLGVFHDAEIFNTQTSRATVQDSPDTPNLY